MIRDSRADDLGDVLTSPQTHPFSEWLKKRRSVHSDPEMIASFWG